MTEERFKVEIIEESTERDILDLLWENANGLTQAELEEQLGFDSFEHDAVGIGPDLKKLEDDGTVIRVDGKYRLIAPYDSRDEFGTPADQE